MIRQFRLHPRAFTLVELLASLAIGLLVAGGAVLGLQNVFVTTRQDSVGSPQWILQADRLLYRDLQQASRIESTPSGLTIHTLAPADLAAAASHERSIITYEVMAFRQERWWVRRGRPAVARSNRRVLGVLLGPADELTSLQVQLSNGPVLVWDAAGGGLKEQGVWEVTNYSPLGGFQYRSSQPEGFIE